MSQGGSGGGWGQPPAGGWGSDPQPGAQDPYVPPMHGDGNQPARGDAQPWSPTEAIAFGWDRLKADPVAIIGTMFVGGLLSGIVSTIGNFAASGYMTSRTLAATSAGSAPPTSLEMWSDPIYAGIRGVTGLLNFPVQTFMIVGMMVFALKVARGQQYRFGDIFAGGPYFLSALASQLLVGLGVVFGSLALIVPGVILALGWFMTMPATIDQKLGPIEAMKESWRITTGHKLSIFLFALLAMCVVLVGILACCVGVFVAAPVIQIASAFIYLRLTGQQTASAAI